MYVRRVCATITAVEEQYIRHILCVCVSAALDIQHAMLMGHIVIRGLPGL